MSMIPTTATTETRRIFGRRLKEVRRKFGYTQAAFAHALGIQAARYNKYEIGRSEPPYEVLIKIARLGHVSLDYLLGLQQEADEKKSSFGAHVESLIQALPTAAVVYDRLNRLLVHNRLYQEIFFPDCPAMVRPGVPLDTLARAWAYAKGVPPEETEEFVHKRLHGPPDNGLPTEIPVGDHHIQIAESRYKGYRLVLLTDVTRFRRRNGGSPTSFDSKSA